MQPAEQTHESIYFNFRSTTYEYEPFIDCGFAANVNNRGNNEELFVALGIMACKHYFAAAAFGYPSRNGSWPACRNNDAAAFVRLCDALRAEAQAQEEGASPWCRGMPLRTGSPQASPEVEAVLARIDDAATRQAALDAMDSSDYEDDSCEDDSCDDDCDCEDEDDDDSEPGDPVSTITDSHVTDSHVTDTHVTDTHVQADIHAARGDRLRTIPTSVYPQVYGTTLAHAAAAIRHATEPTPDQPRPFAVGDRVKLMSDDWGDGEDNPIWGGEYGEIAGTVTRLADAYDVYVVWDHGCTNSYYSGQIALLEPTTTKPMITTPQAFANIRRKPTAEHTQLDGDMITRDLCSEMCSDHDAFRYQDDFDAGECTNDEALAALERYADENIRDTIEYVVNEYAEDTMLVTFRENDRTYDAEILVTVPNLLHVEGSGMSKRDMFRVVVRTDAFAGVHDFDSLIERMVELNKAALALSTNIHLVQAADRPIPPTDEIMDQLKSKFSLSGSVSMEQFYILVAETIEENR